MKHCRTMWSRVLALCVYSLFVFSACTSVDDMPKPLSSSGANSCIVSMKLPGAFSATRAMSPAAEKKLDDKNLFFLVFKLKDGAEKFAYQAPIKGSTVNAATNSVDYELSLVANEEGDQTKSRIVVIANAGPIDIPAVGATKEEALSSISFDIPNAWDTEKAIPMWGQLIEPFVFTKDMAEVKKNISMLRALAKVDVGLSYEAPENQSNDAVEGLDNFKLTAVYLFDRTTKGAVVPATANLSATGKAEKPTIPTDNTSISGDAAELEFAQVIDQKLLAREIYLSEDEAKDAQRIVIGGIYDKDGEASYYAIDFVNTNADKLKYLLRNHYYRINVKRITGRGHKTPAEAYRSVAANVEVDVYVWDKPELKDVFVNGQFYFGVESRKIIVSHEKGARSDMNFTTNIAGFNAATDLMLIPDPAQAFDDTFIADLKDQTLSFTAKNENKELFPIERKFTLVVNNGGKEVFRIPMEIIQNNQTNFFDIECENIKVFGILRQGEPLTERNKLVVKLSTLEGVTFTEPKTIKLVTDVVDGMRFYGEGTFEPGDSSIEITLQGEGKGPANRKAKRFTIRDASGASSTTCAVTIRPALIAHKILLLNDDKNKGLYGTRRNETAKLIENKFNFGNDDQSRVALIAAKLSVEVSTTQTDLSKYDVVIISDPANIDDKRSSISSAALTKYLQEGGSLIYLQERIGRNAEAKARHGNWKFIADLANSSINRYDKADSRSLFSVTDNINDMITNGVFGDVRGSWWGCDGGTETGGISFSNRDNLVVYSTGGSKKNPTLAGGAAAVTMFALKNYNVFCVTDAGFATLPRDGHDRSRTRWPAAADEDPLNPAGFVPIQKLGYGDRASRGGGSTWNSVIFCNALTWALLRADEKYDAVTPPTPPVTP